MCLSNLKNHHIADKLYFKIILVSLLFVLFQFISFFLNAEENNITRPAAIGEHKKSLKNLIRFPIDKAESVDITVLCASNISKKGKYIHVFCLNPLVDERSHYLMGKYTYAVMRASRKATAIPALLDGHIVRVWFQFSVHFIKMASTNEIELCANFGEYQKINCTDYSTPQHVISYPYKVRIRCALCSTAYVSYLQVVVDENGKTESAKIVKDILAPDQFCNNCILKEALQDRYIPGQIMGKHTKMGFLELYLGGYFSPLPNFITR